MKFRAFVSKRSSAAAALVVIGASALGLGCDPQEPAPPWLCVSANPNGTPAQGNSEAIGQVSEALTAKVEALWDNPHIDVCWEKSAIDKTSLADRLLVKQAVMNTWQTALNVSEVPADKRVTFNGWDSCEDNAAAKLGGIRIQADDVNPATFALGKELAGLPGGMVLNFAFKNWSDTCQAPEWRRQTCMYNIAVHEFGHALGLAHEQNRVDTPDTCKQKPQGESGDYNLGLWDNQSVMNYCNPTWNNDGELSSNDQSGIRTLYYRDLAKDYCRKNGTPLAPIASEMATSHNPAVSQSNGSGDDGGTGGNSSSGGGGAGGGGGGSP